MRGGYRELLRPKRRDKCSSSWVSKSPDYRHPLRGPAPPMTHTPAGATAGTHRHHRGLKCPINGRLPPRFLRTGLLSEPLGRTLQHLWRTGPIYRKIGGRVVYGWMI